MLFKKNSTNYIHFEKEEEKKTRWQQKQDRETPYCFAFEDLIEPPVVVSCWSL